MILSDKLDIKYIGFSKEEYNVNGIKELQYIKYILVYIHNNNLEIKFICDNRINKNELEKFYFMIKIFKAIISFSNKMNLNAKVYFNNV